MSDDHIIKIPPKGFDPVDCAVARGKLETLLQKVNWLTGKVAGNGEIGLDEQTRNNAKEIAELKKVAKSNRKLLVIIIAVQLATNPEALVSAVRTVSGLM